MIVGHESHGVCGPRSRGDREPRSRSDRKPRLLDDLEPRSRDQWVFVVQSASIVEVSPMRPHDVPRSRLNQSRLFFVNAINGFI